MGLGSSIKHAVKKVAKFTKETIKSGYEAPKNLLQGDVKGAISELANAATGGYMNDKARRTAEAVRELNARAEAQEAESANAQSREANGQEADASNLLERGAAVNDYSTLLNGVSGINREDLKVKKKSLLGGA